MTLDEATHLARRTLAAIDDWADEFGEHHTIADRERVRSDLAGMRLVQKLWDDERLDGCIALVDLPTLAQLFIDGLHRTASIYEVGR